MSRVLVTGGAGYIGSHIARGLVEAGAAVVVYDDLSTGHRELAAGQELVVGRVEDGELLREVLRRERIDAVVHCAARSLVPESVANPRRYYEANCGGGLVLAGALLDCGVERVVFSSTAATFGEAVRQPIPDDAPLAPVNPYGVTKVLIEDMLAAYATHGLRAVSLRYFNAAGAHPAGDLGEDHDPETHLVPRLLDAALTGGEATVFGTDYPTRDGTCLRDYVHVVDLAAAHVAALRHLEAGGAPARLNLGSGTGTTVREMIDAVREVTGRPLAAREGPRRPGDPAALLADASGARELLGWEPRRSDVRTIVEDAWRWHRRRRGG